MSHVRLILTLVVFFLFRSYFFRWLTNNVKTSCNFGSQLSFSLKVINCEYIAKCIMIGIFKLKYPKFYAL